MTERKILILTPRFPYPVIGGDRLRIFEIARELSREYSVTLASLCESQSEMEYRIPNDGVFDDVHRVFLPKYRSIYNCIKSFPSNVPLQVSYYKSVEFQKLVDRLACDHDLLLPHLVRMADYVRGFKIPKVLEMTDAISMNYERVINTKNKAGIRGLIYKLEYSRLNKYEKQKASDFDGTTFVSDVDRGYLYKKGTSNYKKSIVASNGVDISKYPYRFSQGTREIVFIGNLHSAQNYDAAYWFASKVMPALLKRGQYIFKVIGRITEVKRRRLEAFNGVRCTGAVENIPECAYGAIAGVCSVKLAAGVQNKILEYMALGIPTITTSIGLEGLEAKPNKDLLVADHEIDFVEAIQRLDSEKRFAQDLASSARRYVVKNHSWESRLSPLINKVAMLINKS